VFFSSMQLSSMLLFFLVVLLVFLWAWKQTNLQDFLNQGKNKGKLNFKSKLQNKNTCVKWKSNKILFQEQNKNVTKLWQENVPKIGVKQIEHNGEFHLYLYLLGT
jgi:hypothetical protein